MTWKDTLGSTENSTVRTDHLPPSRMPPPELPSGPHRAPEIPMSCGDPTRVEPPTVGNPDDLPPQD